jgi:hypothetical protein
MLVVCGCGADRCRACRPFRIDQLYVLLIIERATLPWIPPCVRFDFVPFWSLQPKASNLLYQARARACCGHVHSSATLRRFPLDTLLARQAARNDCLDFQMPFHVIGHRTWCTARLSVVGCRAMLSAFPLCVYCLPAVILGVSS